MKNIYNCISNQQSTGMSELPSQNTTQKQRKRNRRPPRDLVSIETTLPVTGKLFDHVTDHVTSTPIITALYYGNEAYAERLHFMLYLRNRMKRDGSILSPESGDICIKQLQPANQKYFASWKKYVGEKMDNRAFLYNCELSSFLQKTSICHAIRFYRHPFFFDEKTGNVCALVDGKVEQDLERIARRLKITGISVFPFKPRRMLVSFHNKDEHWAYLPTLGLTKWDSEYFQELKPCARMTNVHVKWVQQHAIMATTEALDQEKKYQENAGHNTEIKHTVVLEVITSKSVVKSIPPLLDGMYDLWVIPRHPYIRITTPSGFYYCFGFNRRFIKEPDGSIHLCGGFISPDPVETQRYAQKIITGIRISTEQFYQVISIVNKWQQKGNVRFHILDHNCSSFIESIFKQLLQNSPHFPKPRFRANVAEAAFLIQPKSWRCKEMELAMGMEHIKDMLTDLTPPILNRTTEFLMKQTRLILSSCMHRALQHPNVSALDRAPFQKTDDSAEKTESPVVMIEDNKGKLDVAKGETDEKQQQEKPIKNHDKHEMPIFLPCKVTKWQMRLEGTRVVDGKCNFWEQYQVHE